MKELLGFVVLTGPLFLVVLWVPVCFFLAVLVGRKFIKKSLPVKIAGGVAVFLFTLILPVSDEIAGRIYFNHLCETEAGVKVYQTIELPAEYWDENGKPNFYDESNGNFTLPSEKFYKVKSRELVHQFGVQEQCALILDINSQKIVGEKPWFLYWGGYVRKNFTPHNKANSCGGDWSEFVKRQFTQNSTKDGK